ncbi:endonuclease-reverse transcriptase HmRTE-e01 [Danaus plexippus plexippus]|uniref:Endonuclease-reverse transcriptase HmRTE-e01 n=1 Tax=Danaus plexippus plexippus TaxID=278856 RepID=A0A212F3F1_DANPL|nr:endonuclease-reverse transcriptase HmRTE-e01 [Danaus plexippus plexippus]
MALISYKFKTIYPPKPVITFAALRLYLSLLIMKDKAKIKATPNARAYPQSVEKIVGAHQYKPKMRIATWNVGSMTGRSAELSEIWQKSGSNDDREIYRSVKKEAKREVARAMATCGEDFYIKLETAKDDRELLRLARYRYANSLDILTKYIKNKDGHLLTSNSDIKARRREHYSHLLNESS